MVYTLFSLMFKVFFVAAAAYLLRRRGALTAQDQKSVTNVLMRFVVYFTVIMSSQQDFSLKAAKAILVTAIYAVLFFAVFIPASIFLSRRLKLEEAKRRIFVCSLVSATSPLSAIRFYRSCTGISACCAPLCSA